MIDTAFPPGPWGVVENGSSYVKDPQQATLRIEQKTEDEFVVALIVTDICTLADKAEATAYLIAAAPDAVTFAEAVLDKSEQPHLRAMAQEWLAKARACSSHALEKTGGGR